MTIEEVKRETVRDSSLQGGEYYSSRDRTTIHVAATRRARSEISIDFCGPLPLEEYLLVIVDELSRYLMVKVVRSTFAETVIPVFDKVFSLFSFSEVVKTDIVTSERDATRRGRLATGLRNNDGRCHLVISYLKGAAICRMQLGSDHRNTNGIPQILAQLVLVTVPPMDTCVLRASVTSVVRQITSPRLADM
ncbi:hypothetical protein NP493_11g11006 [Ridgeia piscesae]|uniref:Integrase catalytic domain-containing protein n=1 Tax=Ridgeia piscesae TaxID=27915 RepID=A0AAD9J837_RIDPI|nr:hypothetical protein NP493_3264g00003 [Ridgeia piscesae]KAK2193620.1 hypothetical protein NP493_11g11006 [Ridgeia piscesae]